MLIAHVRFVVSSENRQRALAALMADAETIRAMPGCIAFTPFFEPTNNTVLGVLHEWESEEDFADYLASEPFRMFGITVRPMMAGKPVSKRFNAKLIDVVN